MKKILLLSIITCSALFAASNTVTTVYSTANMSGVDLNGTKAGDVLERHRPLRQMDHGDGSANRQQQDGNWQVGSGEERFNNRRHSLDKNESVGE